MHHSVEIRVPFIDHKLIESLGQLPVKYRYNNRIKKYWLIKSIGNFPCSTIKKKKKCFEFPFDIWLKGCLKEYIRDILLSSDLFDKKVMDSTLSEYYKGRLHWSRIWSLVVLTRALR